MKPVRKNLHTSHEPVKTKHVIGDLHLDTGKTHCALCGKMQDNSGAAVVQWNHACFGVRGVSKHKGSNPVHGPSVGWASSLEATVS
ncbi:hypothetical protein E2C01_066204 [Portunus trituberculatus]|uniref:Uncharacterized protein n=1 Tax=Portunus trituberculatus TaxID=210409 RepID=A0A5B7HKW1_PORTR|nr:hypothetical protein [Portunus trituberculatus]